MVTYGNAARPNSPVTLKRETALVNIHEGHEVHEKTMWKVVGAGKARYREKSGRLVE